MPAQETPQANAWAVVCVKLDRIIIALIRQIFNKIGVAAAAANLPNEFNTPDINETKEINNKYGNVILVKSIARLNFSESSKNPGANTIIK